MRVRRGISLLELLIVVAIISIMAAQLFPMISQAKRLAIGTTDITNMKQVYMAIVMYESDFDDRAPETVLLTLDYAKNKAIYESKLDPRPPDPMNAGWPPVPFFRGNRPRIDFRISYPYLKNFMAKDYETGDRWDYYYQRKRSEIGIIASPWVGEIIRWTRSVRDGESDDTTYGPLMRGPIYRINMDGSFFRIPRRIGDDFLGASMHDMFFYRP